MLFYCYMLPENWPFRLFQESLQGKKQGIIQPGGRAGDKTNEPNDHIRSMIAGLVF